MSMSRHGEILPRDPYKRRSPTIILPAGITVVVDNDDLTRARRVTFKEDRKFFLIGWTMGIEADLAMLLTDCETKIPYVWDNIEVGLPPY